MSLYDKLSARAAGFLDDVLLPDEVRVQLLRARRALDGQDYADVLRLVADLESRKGAATRVWELRGLAYLGQGQHAKAVDALRRAASVKPTATLLGSLATALQSAGDLRGARDAYRQAVLVSTRDEEASELLAGLGSIYLALERPDKAIHELSKALRLASDGRDYGVRLALGRALLAHGRARDALDVALPTLGRESTTDDAVTLVGRTLLELGQAEEALAHLKGCPRHPDGPINAARAALVLGRSALALELLEAAPEPSSQVERGRLLTVAGQAHLLGDQLVEAVEVLRRAEAATPREPETLVALAWATLRLSEELDGQVGEAEGRFGALRGRVPRSGAVLHGLGRCRMARGEHQTACRLLAAAVALGAGDEAIVDLGRSQFHIGEVGAAIETLTRVAAGDPAIAEVAGRLLTEAHRVLAGGIDFPEPGCRDLGAWRRAADGLRDRLAVYSKLGPFAERARRLVEGLETPLKVAVVGEFNAGKSTLVNALLGEEVVPVGVLPTTAQVSTLRYGPHRLARVHLRSGEIEELAFTDVKRRVKADTTDAIEHIEYLTPHPVLRRIVLLDTPGFNALDPRHEREAHRALAEAEAVLWVCDANQVLTDSEFEILRGVEASSERLVVVINKIDRFGDHPERAAASAELISHTTEGLTGAVRHICAVSAAEGLAHQRRDPHADAQPDTSGLGELLTFLEREVFDRATALKSACIELDLDSLRSDTVAEVDAISAVYASTAHDLTGLRQMTSDWQEGFGETTCVAEAARLGDELDFLLELVLREINDALKPSAGLLDSLLTRMELDTEDIDFILDLVTRRTAGLLERSEARVSIGLVEFEAQLADRLEAAVVGLEPSHAKALRARLDGTLTELSMLRRLLTERVYQRYRHAAVEWPCSGARDRVIEVAHGELDHREKIAQLTGILPDIKGTLAGSLTKWAMEYATATERFSDAASSDLKVMLIEFQALRQNLTRRDRDNA